MKLLAIDTSTDYLSLAVMDGDRALARVHRKAPRAHSSRLMPMIGRVLKAAKTPLKKLDGFAISIGPGSFTGLRIGVVTVKGLAYAAKKPIVAVPTMDAIAENAANFRGIICVALDARKNKVYAGIYKSDGRRVKRVSKFLLIPVPELLKRLAAYDSVTLLGDYAEKIGGLLPKSVVAAVSWQPTPEIVGRLGIELFNKGKFTDVEDLEPFYIYTRECDITGK